MKLNWGTGIALVYGFFALSMVGVVFASRQHDPGLVQKNYYDLDLNYQARMNKKQNASALKALPVARFNASEKSVTIQFPMLVAGGSVKLYRSATTQDDFSVKIENSEMLTIPAENMAPGRWHLELDWDAGATSYFWETVVEVN